MADKGSNKKKRSSGSGNRSPHHRVPLTVGRKELLVDGTDNAFREMVHNALAFSVRLEAVREGFARYVGLSGVQYTILISIAHLQDGGDIGVSEIAEHLSLSGTFVTTETRKLVGLGLLTKEVSEEDRRRVQLRLTNKAWKRLEELSEIQAEVNDEHFAPLSATEFVKFNTLMKKLTNSTDRALLLLEHHLAMKQSDSA
ncbi:MAG: MarR family winged helix-turn-helix transcriptional regulator [Pseudomonadota bacterium]